MVLGSYSSHCPATWDQNTTQSRMPYFKQKGQQQTEIFLQIPFSSQMTKMLLSCTLQENIKDAYFHCIVLVATLMSLTSFYIVFPIAQMLAASYCCSKLKMIKKTCMHSHHTSLPASGKTNSLPALGRDSCQELVLVIDYFSCLSIELWEHEEDKNKTLWDHESLWLRTWSAMKEQDHQECVQCSFF